MTKAIIPVFTLFLIGCANKQSEPFKTEHLEVELVSELTSIQPGVAFWVAVKFQLEEGWHINWKNPGDAGLAPTIKWELPPGFTAGEITWPIPQRIPVGDLMLFGYDETVLLMVEITSPSTFDEDEVILSALFDWVVCGDVCIPGEANLTLTLPVKEETPEINQAHAMEFASTRLHSPTANDIFYVNVSAIDDAMYIDISPVTRVDNKIGNLVFFPEVQGIINNAVEQRFFKDGISYRLVIGRDRMFPNVPENLKGVLVFSSGESFGGKGVKIDVPLKN